MSANTIAERTRPGLEGDGEKSSDARRRAHADRERGGAGSDEGSLMADLGSSQP